MVLLSTYVVLARLLNTANIVPKINEKILDLSCIIPYIKNKKNFFLA